MSTALAPPMTPATRSADEHAPLAGEVRSLGDALIGLAGEQHAERLLRIMHRPGWTTPVEAALVSTMVGHLTDQLAALRRGHDTLLAAAGRIGA